ncbi:aminotransferase class V-fold PLP-dependent enzyme [Azotosporobacter soli]|uniref:aminotransferase class V-fold PLP-dependent enzyme n=1 Tax=Azotosporobacter soli TaxID=3055040 RepID=UPI0031FEB336
MKFAYLNNAATSWPKPLQVSEAVAACIQQVPCHSGRAAFDRADAAGTCRTLLAELLQVTDERQIVFAPNATHALNVALHGLRWQSGANVVTSAAEHNSVLRPLHYLAKTKGLQIRIVPVDHSGRIVVEEWAAAIKKYRPQLAVFMHASNVTGAVNDAALLAKLAKEAGAVTLLDASQSMGIIPVFPEQWKIDLVAFTGHKYLLGPTGTGGLYIAPHMTAELEPVWVGGTGIQSELDEMPSMMPTHFEAGTPNDCAFAGLAAALAWRSEHPLEEKGLHSLTERLCSGLKELGANVIDVEAPRTPVVSFTLENWAVEEVGEILQKSFGIVSRTGLHCAPRTHAFLATAPSGTVRLSLSRFTTEQEIEDCLSAIGAMLRETD